MPKPSLVEKVLAVMTALERAGIPAALGGALALAYYAEPRATSDADINVFVGAEQAERVLDALAAAGVEASEADRATARAREQVRLWFAGTPIDIFFGGLPLHDSCSRRAHVMPFNGGSVRVLSAEDLVVFKVLFNRPKDWLDIQQVLATQGSAFERDYALHWLDEIIGPSDSARMRFAEMLTRIS